MFWVWTLLGQSIRAWATLCWGEGLGSPKEGAQNAVGSGGLCHLGFVLLKLHELLSCLLQPETAN